MRTDVEILNLYQVASGSHPLTCGYCRKPPALVAPGHAINGDMQMRCPRCESVQRIAPGAVAAARRFLEAGDA